MKKIVVLMMAVVFAVIGCVACAAPAAQPETASESAAATGAASDGEGLVFGFTTITNSNEFMVKIQKEIEDKCAELGIEVICNDPDMDATKQISQVESFIAQGVDAIIMDPCDADASSPAVTKAQEAGIPIINVNSVTTTAPDVFVGSRDEESSELAIEFIAEKLGRQRESLHDSRKSGAVR